VVEVTDEELHSNLELQAGWARWGSMLVLSARSIGSITLPISFSWQPHMEFGIEA
jgi:hypothetical protein